MKEKATIYDLWRMCKYFKGNCIDCPLYGKICVLKLNTYSRKSIDEANEILLNWCKEHPVKTRQDKFLEMFPNAPIYTDGVLEVKPCHIGAYAECSSEVDCDYCRSKYWLAEVEE